MNRLLANYIDRVLKKGSLELIDARGRFFFKQKTAYELQV